jgi:hypothetical protein
MSAIIQLKSFQINEIWLLGTRIYFNDDFVSIKPFEEDAYSFFTKYQNDPQFGHTAHKYCKRVHQTYTQKIDELVKLKEELEKSGEFKEVELRDEPSSIGLPKILVYTHIKTDIYTEFDGLIFVSVKRISDQEFKVEDAKDFIQKEGSVTPIYDQAQIGSNQHQFSEKFSYNISASCNWRYTTGSVDFSNNNFNPEVNIDLLVFYVSLIDENIVYFNMPHGTMDAGKNYYFLIGDRLHIKEVITHDLETLRYLKFLENRLKLIREDILEVQGKLFNQVPLLPWSWKLINPQTYSQSIGYSTYLQRCLENIVKYRLYLPIFREVIEAYKEYEEKGIGFYNLTNPIMPFQSQYKTKLPYPLEIENNKIKVNKDVKLLCGYVGYPEKLNNFLLTLQKLADETFELLQSITVIPALQTGMVATVVSLMAMLISIIAFIFAPAVNSLYNFFQPSQSPLIKENQELLLKTPEAKQNVQPKLETFPVKKQKLQDNTDVKPTINPLKTPEAKQNIQPKIEKSPVNKQKTQDNTNAKPTISP